MSKFYYDMDEKVKRAAGRPYVLFNESSWIKMEALLDEEDMDIAVVNVFNTSAMASPREKTYKNIPALILFILLVVITGIVAICVADSAPTDAGIRVGKTPSYAEENTLFHNKSIKSLKELSMESVREKSLNLNTVQLNKNTGRPNSSLKHSIEGNTSPTHFDNRVKGDKKIGSSILKSNGEYLPPPNHLFVNRTMPEVTGLVQKDSSAAISLLIMDYLKKVKMPPLNFLPNVDKAKTSSKNRFIKHVGFYVAVAPEINNVALKEVAKVTSSYGAGIYFNIGKNISLHTGFTSANKVYQTDRKGYHPPPGSIFLPLDTLQVSAVCRVIDIPINIRYHFSGNENSGFFISTGISSYLMKKEKYDFVYFDQGVYKTRQGNFKNRNNHFSSNLNLSAGYSTRINKKLFLNIEPYLKLPLHGVGMGKVKLTSAGFVFSANVLLW